MRLLNLLPALFVVLTCQAHAADFDSLIGTYNGNNMAKIFKKACSLKVEKSALQGHLTMTFTTTQGVKVMEVEKGKLREETEFPGEYLVYAEFLGIGAQKTARMSLSREGKLVAFIYEIRPLLGDTVSFECIDMKK